MRNLLFISRGVPNRIKSAGDIRAFRMLSVLKDRYNITVVASSADYGIGDVRGLGCSTFLTGNPKAIIDDLITVNNIGYIILAHWSIAENFIDDLKAKKKDAKIIVDTIDVEFLRTQRENEYRGSDKVVDKERELNVYKKADYVIVVSEDDKNELAKYGDFKFLYFPCVFEVNENYQLPNNNKAYTICNWLHKPNIDAVKYTCEKIIPHVDVKFHVVGKHPPKEIVCYASDKVFIHGVEYEINKFLKDVSICLSPVVFGAGINGKLGESLAYGIPVVTTPMGAKPYVLEHGKTAMIGSNETELIDCVNELLKNEKLRKSLSDNGRNLIREKFTVEKHKDFL